MNNKFIEAHWAPVIGLAIVWDKDGITVLLPFVYVEVRFQ